MKPDELFRKAGRLGLMARGVPKAVAEAARGNYTPRRIRLDWSGRPQRFDLINAIVQKFGYRDYLEIGCRSDECFAQVEIAHRVGVDPAQGGTLKMTSDEYFATHHEHFDLVFIDGLHTYAQVKADIRNALNVLRDQGTILLHDCLPTNCLAQYDFPVIPQWNGDVWKAVVEARTFPHADTAVVLIDQGVGIIRKRKNLRPLAPPAADFRSLRYRDLVANYKEWLNTIEYSEVMAFLDAG